MENLTSKRCWNENRPYCNKNLLALSASVMKFNFNNLISTYNKYWLVFFMQQCLRVINKERAAVIKVRHYKNFYKTKLVVLTLLQGLIITNTSYMIGVWKLIVNIAPMSLKLLTTSILWLQRTIKVGIFTLLLVMHIEKVLLQLKSSRLTLHQSKTERARRLNSKINPSISYPIRYSVVSSANSSARIVRRKGRWLLKTKK